MGPQRHSSRIPRMQGDAAQGSVSFTRCGPQPPSPQRHSLRIPKMQGDAADIFDGDETSGTDLETDITSKSPVGSQALKMLVKERTFSTPTTAADDDDLLRQRTEEQEEPEEQEIGEDTHQARTVEAQPTDCKVENHVSPEENHHV